MLELPFFPILENFSSQYLPQHAVRKLLARCMSHFKNKNSQTLPIRFESKLVLDTLKKCSKSNALQTGDFHISLSFL